MRVVLSFLCLILLASPAFAAESGKHDFSRKHTIEKKAKAKKAEAKPAAAAKPAKKEEEKTENPAPKAPAVSVPFTLKVDAFDPYHFIKPQYAFCMGAGKTAGHGQNISPAVSWVGAPEGTESFALVMHDPDVPTDFTNANKEGVEIEGNQPRQIFYHWVLADIPASVSGLKEGAEGKGVKLGKFKPGKAKVGVRGINDYTKFMKDDPKLAGIYAGYDGPCPPWNDSRPHRYIFTLYALKVKELKLPEHFTGQDVLNAVKGNTIAQTSVKGEYSANPRFQKTGKSARCR